MDRATRRLMNTMDAQIFGAAMWGIPAAFEITKAGVVLIGTVTC
jgi:hypothetical protein